MANIEQLKPQDLNCNIFSCYDYDGYSLQEILCQFFHKINEVVEVADRTVDLAEWLVSEGLAEEVAKTLVKWRDDGTLAKIINVTIFEDLNKKVDGNDKKINAKVDSVKEVTDANIEYNSKIYPTGEMITDPLITDYSQKLTCGDNFEPYPRGYGDVKFHVKGKTVTFTGAVNIKSSLYDDHGADAYEITHPWVALKQPRPVPFNMVGYDAGYTRSSNFLATLNNDGRLMLDDTVYHNFTSGGRQDNCVALNATFPLEKNYSLKDDYSNKMDAWVKEILSLQNELTSTVTLASDTHTNVEYNTKFTFGDYDIYFPTLLNYMNTHTGAFTSVLNGDIITEKDGVNTDSLFEWLMFETRRQYNENTLFVLGNHDDQSLSEAVKLGQAQPIPKTKFNEWMNKGKTGVNFAAGNEPFFYADDNTGRCRHIMLNSHDTEGKKIHTHIFGSSQAKWLVDVLNGTPADYSIVLYSHISPKESKDMKKDGGNHMVNGDGIHQLLKDYKNRQQGSWRFVDGVEVTWDFRRGKGFIAGVFSGHEHEDYEVTTDGINYIVEASALYNNEALSCMLVDSKHRRIKVKRYAFKGAGRKSVDLPF